MHLCVTLMRKVYLIYIAKHINQINVTTGNMFDVSGYCHL